MYRRIALIAINIMVILFGHMNQRFSKLEALSTSALPTIDVPIWLLICQKGIWNTLALDARIYATLTC